MFDFDYWADWLRGKADEFEPKADRLIEYLDSRPFPETSLNPSFGLKLDTNERIGQIGYWRIGLCDFAVFDVASGTPLVDVGGLEANDATVPLLFAKFMSFYDEPENGV